jgi:hypothetical protein
MMLNPSPSAVGRRHGRSPYALLTADALAINLTLKSVAPVAEADDRRLSTASLLGPTRTNA